MLRLNKKCSQEKHVEKMFKILAKKFLDSGNIKTEIKQNWREE